MTGPFSLPWRRLTLRLALLVGLVLLVLVAVLVLLVLLALLTLLLIGLLARLRLVLVLLLLAALLVLVVLTIRHGSLRPFKRLFPAAPCQPEVRGIVSKKVSSSGSFLVPRTLRISMRRALFRGMEL